MYYWKGDTLLKYDQHHAAKLNRLMKEGYLSQKLIAEQDQILFSDKNFSFATNDYSKPEDF